MDHPDTAIILYNRDLRVHDHPALAEACARARHVVPLFVADPAIRPRHRGGFLAEALEDLRASLRDLGGDLVVRHGDPVAEALRVAADTGASAIWASADVSAYARARERRLERECAAHRLDFRLFPGVTVVPPGLLRPAGGDHYRVFTPYWRAWRDAGHRQVTGPPPLVRLPPGVEPGRLPRRPRAPYGHLRGGETVARRRLDLWLKLCLADYEDGHDDLAEDRTSMLSPYLRFGCVSPSEVAARATGYPGAEAFVRQLCWRDFYHQVALAFPELPRRDYRPRRVDWNEDGHAADAWRAGMTGVPIVDAGMRQLQAEGWMHNRARLIVGSYLTKRLRIHWRVGGEHFADLLLDGDVADNWGNWQWVAGTGNDTRPNRVLNPLRQARRFDPDGDYVRRHVPELAALPASLIHEPWKAAPKVPGYPAPLPTPDNG
ncbi:cryptochrome/photolyase family protein [Sphaerisporangium krabiense]|uniref:Deoxyribodipyrimidine photo-lyase n=1 Tax=Sphaerisporangium krabiense TaxID=763782 RepID=A0A7W8YZ26_9ACTN|nr:deoxyribodipyrimidine photo-lyase [Sphaerisporangium krabiense]MBB5624464.1 deoxyribodipyrimidine photo-lyase [Sphaerisporangium krabiense]